jgi:ribonuclease R
MRRPLPTRTAVLEALSAEDSPIHLTELAEKLAVGPESHQGLLRLLDDLVFDGVVTARGERFKLDKKIGKVERAPEKVERAPEKVAKVERVAEKVERIAEKKGLPPTAGRRREAPTGSSKSDGDGGGPPPRRRGGREQREGVLTVNPRGFGFVASPTASGDDVFIGADALSGAMHGDLVTVEIIARGSRGAEGQIVAVNKRGTTRVSGILRRKGKNAWIELDDPRVRGPVVLTREIDRTGPEGNSGQEGQVVVAEITRFPDQPGENPEGKIIAVLGQPGELAVEVNKILLIEKIEEVHSSQAVAEAEAYGLEVPTELLEGREDLTHIPLPTIDPDDARDHDDAVWVERTPSGGYEVWVAIADVSTYVRPETKIDEEASARGCSIYLPDRAIPMLPRALSSNLCSLLPDVTRLCLAVHAELDAKGVVKKSRLVRGFMKSAAKLTYGGVARALGFTAEPPRQPKAEEMIDGLRVAHEVSRILRSRRMSRGALDFDLPEPVVKLDAEGKPSSVTKRTKDPGVKKAYQLIEELMIFANEVVARWLIEHKLPGVFRVHLPPDPQKLQRLAAMCEMLGVELDIDETQTPKGLANILESFADHPNVQVLNNLLLRSMKQATYDVANLGHFGLASEAYLHFTSPIRRYPDLVVHRVVHAALIADDRARKKQLAQSASQEQLQEAALKSSVAERRAMEVERAILDIYRCFYMIDHIGERFEGTVSAFVGSGAFVTLDDPFCDVLIKVEDLGPDFQIEDDGLMATSKRSGDALRLGDRLLVEVTDCAILRRTVYARRVRGEQDTSERRPRGAFGGGEAPARRGPGGGPSRGRPDDRSKPTNKRSKNGKRDDRPGSKESRGGPGFTVGGAAGGGRKQKTKPGKKKGKKRR